MKYVVRIDGGVEQTFSTREALVVAYNQGNISGNWAARAEEGEQWQTVASVLNLNAPVFDTPESRAERDASASLWILVALPFVCMLAVPLGFILLEDAGHGWFGNLRYAAFFCWLASTSIFGLYKGIRAARFGIRKGIVGAVVNGLIILGVCALAVLG
jgi:hypothetical protein